MSEKSSREIAEAVLDELRGRKGIGNAFDDIDDEIIEEITETVARIIAEGCAA